MYVDLNPCMVTLRQCPIWLVLVGMQRALSSVCGCVCTGHLQADGERRRIELEKARADKAEREAKALALVSVGPGFSRRPRSAK
jgi:hypothetical protein